MKDRETKLFFCFFWKKKLESWDRSTLHAVLVFIIVRLRKKEFEEIQPNQCNNDTLIMTANLIFSPEFHARSIRTKINLRSGGDVRVEGGRIWTWRSLGREWDKFLIKKESSEWVLR